MIMTVMLEKLKTLFVAEETIPGECEESGLTAVGVFNQVYTPEFENEVKNMNLGILGKSYYFPNCRRPIMTFSTYIRGSGIAADTPPQEAPFYKAAGLEEIIDTGVSVAYSPTSDKSLWEWLTVHFWYSDAGNDYVVKACGCVLTGVLRFEPCKPGIIDWRLEGIFREITTLKDFYADGGVPGFNKTTIDNPQPPQCLGGALTIESFTPSCSNMFEIDLGNEITPRLCFGPKHGHAIPYISDRNTTGTLQIEIPNVADFDVQGAIVDA